MMTDTKHTTAFDHAEIPKGWVVRKLGDVGKIRMCKRVFNHETSEVGDIPFFKIGTFGKEPDAFISKELYDNYRKRFSFPKEGDILISAAGTIGRTVVYDGSPAYFQDSNIVWIDNSEATALNQFLYYVYQIVKYESEGGTIQRLYNSIIRSANFLCPPLPEQRAIARLLSTWDTAIHTTEKLIAQKELRKKWLMQQLLTGKRRLPGFGGENGAEGEWKEVRLGKLFNPIRNVNDGGDSHSIMTISSRLGLIAQEDKFDRVIAGESLKKYTQLIRGDFAYNKGNSKTYPMGCIYRLEEKKSALVPFVYICFRPSDLVDGEFYKHWFLAHGLDSQLNKIITSGARGDGLLNVNTDDFFNLKILYPPKKEQTAIALVLQAADKEIGLLKAKAEKLREQKKGLMQVLLTGRVRIKIDNKTK